MENKIASRIDGVKQEKLNFRPSEYSEWHRSLGKEYLAIDIDFVEYRLHKGLVGLFAITGNLEDERHINNSKKYIIGRTEVERRILKELSKGRDFSAYIVLHTKDLSLFHVWNLSCDETPTWKAYNKIEYESFIKSL